MTTRLAIAVALSSAPLAWPQVPAPGTPPRNSTTRVTPNFRDVPIEQLADAVGQATGKTFIVAPNVKAQMSLINPGSYTPTELYYAFLNVLQVNGFAAVPAGNNIVKIVQDTNARQLPGNDLPNSLNAGSDEMVTTVIEVKNISANQVSTVLRQLLSTSALLQAIPGTNSMVITDRAGNVARIQKILSRVDQTSTNGIDVIRLENATAADVVRTLNALTAGQPADAAAGLVPKIAADDRSNSVLISGDPAARIRLAAWIANLDTPLENGGGTESRYLKYADAEKVQAKLKEQLTGIAAVTGTPGAAGAAAASGGASPATIVAYKETNSLIITAPPKMMRQLWAIVDKLDIPRAQVVVEAIIADVSTDKSADLGVNWAVFSNKDNTSTPAGGFISPVGNANGNPVSIVDLTKSVLNPAAASTVPLGATVAIGRLRDNGLNFAAMIRALRADANTNVIATPQLTAMDNQEAKLESGQDVPFLTGQYTNSSTNNNGNVNPFTTVNRQKVG
ncbi:MAG TPA: secretin N-terminal domain-containing protein, partial [Steroidobacteraceae bacterium]|nr:secretin N-terminal domain-containing protein [Steroidobacteraceae bacterium]